MCATLHIRDTYLSMARATKWYSAHPELQVQPTSRISRGVKTSSEFDDSPQLYSDLNIDTLPGDIDEARDFSRPGICF
jgi:hypothetical protein